MNNINDQPDDGSPDRDGELLGPPRSRLSTPASPTAHLPLTWVENTIEAIPKGKQQRTVDKIAQTR